MAVETATKPVEDSIGKVADEIAVGEDLEFQRRWWKFERATWIFFGVIVSLDLAGVFGRGPAAQAHKATPDGAMSVKYERVERFSTPSILTIQFGPTAVRDGAIKLWVSESVVKKLGNQRIIPEPASSQTMEGGILYSFSSGPGPTTVEFALQPASPGLSHFTIRLVPGGNVEAPMDFVRAGVFVMP